MMFPNRWARLSRWGSTWLPLPRPWGTETGRRRPTTSSTTRWTPRYSTRVVFNPSDPPLQVWDLFYDADSVRSMLTRKIQEESLRTYLFTYSNVYDSISIVSNEIRLRILFIFTKFSTINISMRKQWSLFGHFINGINIEGNCSLIHNRIVFFPFIKYVQNEK